MLPLFSNHAFLSPARFFASNISSIFSAFFAQNTTDQDVTVARDLFGCFGLIGEDGHTKKWGLNVVVGGGGGGGLSYSTKSHRKSHCE